MYTSESKLRVRYAETDQMGIVYHANYYVWFEVGRGDFLRDFGMSYKEMESMNIVMPVIETSCRYKLSARYDDQLTIRTTVKQMGAVRMYFHYEVIRDSDGKLLAEGDTGHAFVNWEQKPLNLKKYNNELYNRLCKISLGEEEK